MNIKQIMSKNNKVAYSRKIKDEEFNIGPELRWTWMTEDEIGKAIQAIAGAHLSLGLRSTNELWAQARKHLENADAEAKEALFIVQGYLQSHK